MPRADEDEKLTLQAHCLTHSSMQLSLIYVDNETELVTYVFTVTIILIHIISLTSHKIVFCCYMTVLIHNFYATLGLYLH
jgi:hypothetical protein